MWRGVSRPRRWSKRTDELLREVAGRCRPGLQTELGRWLESSARFAAFMSSNRDKVRKKFSGSDEEESRLDVRAELLIAYLLLSDRRFEVVFESYGSGRRGPDLSVTFRENVRFNLEVTRLRATSDSREADGEPSGTAGVYAAGERSGATGVYVVRLANVIAGKLRQLPAEVPNALVIVARGLTVDEDTLAAAARLLKSHSDVKDDEFFARRKLKSARDFYAQYLHLSGVFAVDEAAVPRAVIFSANREARHPLPRDAATAVSACFAAD